MASKDKDLKKIIAGCKKGNPGYQKKLYDRFAPFMLSVCSRYARNHADAADIFQEGFLKIYENIHQLRNEDAIMWWMKRIFVNEALKFYKKQADLFIVDDLSDLENIMFEDNPVFSKISTKELTRMIQGLPHKMRMVFNMYVIEGFSHQEISDILGISVGTSKSNLHDARKILQARISLLQKNKKYG